MANKFPDLTGDGKVTQADVLKGRGVDSMKKGGVAKSAKYMSFSKTGAPAGMKNVTKMASGGSTASSRADGCCTKGKTRGKMY